jgi:hypothetical protein
MIEGIYEVCIGVQEPTSAIQYWEQFGYRLGQTGELWELMPNEEPSVLIDFTPEYKQNFIKILWGGHIARHT